MTVQVIRDADLTPFNTLRLPARAAALARPHTMDQLATLLTGRDPRLPLQILGEGSNLVLRGDLPGLTLIPALDGMTCVREDGRHVWVAAGAGVRWDDLVAWTVARGWQGLENLSLIPGNAGAAPFQNIGAYGVELSQVLEQVTAMAVDTGVVHHFSASECDFAYRDSRFKSADRGRYVITGIELRLNRQAACNVEYGPLKAVFANQPPEAITPAAVRERVIAVRQSKLPDPSVLPNAGSFFKNPVVSDAQHTALSTRFPDLVAFPQPAGAKLAAGWLIEQAGWKGRRLGPVGMHSEQALVLVNHGGATSADVLALAAAVRDSVRTMFGVELEQEPILLP
ncbi:UDP-N-acetylenolpyruvoylglucosamine reductase [Alcanivorax hongdengensis A-11-3]|uniref:UDP-N-acetylenolpyruvoylglucosamine reductase n=1 Tax=Alcanivorax hongdengensis A-11-3 TaxID=1177179 RepID=L0WGD1_9GAMM|nr:UDP-N-acetylmuramate dehydrogenase [Alcanivorax hongdengensis]EKF75217.1 UDP-N-acetylenolpyruvoylglucosamine reductase [Alcanivorax hongdengensis A-11-3]